MLAIIQFVLTMKKEEASTLLVTDNICDSLQHDLVDFAFGAGVVSYLCLNGLGKPEKSVKVGRFSHIMQMLHSMSSKDDAEEDQAEEWTLIK